MFLIIVQPFNLSHAKAQDIAMAQHDINIDGTTIKTKIAKPPTE